MTSIQKLAAGTRAEGSTPVSGSAPSGGAGRGSPASSARFGTVADPKAIEAYEAAGFDRVVHYLPSAGRGPVERELDAWESAITEFTGETPAATSEANPTRDLFTVRDRFGDRATALRGRRMVGGS